MAFQRVSALPIEIICGKIVDERDRSVACMRGNRKIFIPRSICSRPDLSVGDEIGKVVISLHLARKFGLLA